MAKEQKKATGSKTMLLGASGILLLALIFTVIALWNPNSKAPVSEQVLPENQTWSQTVSSHQISTWDDSLDVSGQNSLSLSTWNTMTAEQAIKDYLTSANQDIQSETVKSGDTITVDYIGRLNDSEVFDTSVESVAQASGKYNPNRNYSEGLSFKVGAGQMIAGFDAGVVGMKVGETKTIKIPAAQAYGERSEENIVRFPIKDLGEDAKDAKVGMQVYLGGRFPAVITEITDTEIVFDANHELAGKDLIFDITIKNIAPATK